MATSKPRIQAYVEQYLFDCFKGEQEAWGLTQSEALERILAERYGKVSPMTTEPPIPYLNDRLQSLEKTLAVQLGINDDLLHRLERLENLLTLNSKSPVSEGELLDGEVESESNSKLPVLDYLENQESKQVNSDLPLSNSEGELPSESLFSELVVSESELHSSDSSSDLPSEFLPSESIVSNSELSISDSRVSGSELNTDTSQRFVVCAYHPDNPNKPLYWHGTKKGFREYLESASSYAHENKARRQGLVIENNAGKWLEQGWKVSYKTIEELRKMKLKYSPA